MTNDLMTIAWRDFLIYAIGNADIREEFSKDTGMSLTASTGIDAMIDAATGYGELIRMEFAMWVTHALWGDEGVPEKFLKEVRAKYPTYTSPIAECL